ncbi:MAG: APC family permease [Thermoplasmata archaeon]|jgi:amino acid transporter|nr:APC family permease [Thermoplasmata archaeon]
MGGRSQQKRVFLRESTGLVREMKPRDALYMNFLNMSIGLGVAWVIFWGPGIYPGADVELGLLICLVCCMFGMFCFATLTAAMPRSGGDYVFVSRCLHPSLGFMASWTWVSWNIVWCGVLGTWVVTWGLRDLLAMLAVLENDPNLIAWANDLSQPDNPITLTITSLVVVLSSIMLALGLKVYIKVQAVCAILGLVMLLVAALLFANTSNAEWEATWNEYAEQQGTVSYDATVTDAAADFPTSGLPFGEWGLTLGMLPVGFWVLAYPYFSAYMGGELKRAKTTAFIGNMGGVMIGGIFVIGMYALVTNTLSEEFIIGTYAQYYDYTGWDSGGNVYGMPSQWFNFHAGLIGGNTAVAYILGVGMIGWLLMYPALAYLGQTRATLAWSFDRLIPAWFGKVSDRWHTPINAIIFFTVVNWIYLLIYAFTFTYQQSFTAQLGQILGTFLFVGLAAIALPYRRRTKPIYEASGANWKIGGVPIVAIAGVVWVAFDLICLWYFLIDPNLGASDEWSEITPHFSVFLTFGIMFAGFAYYWAIRWHRKRQGIDVDLAFKELPPE